MCRFIPTYYYGRGNLVSEHKRPPAYKEQQPNGKKKKKTLQQELMRYACVRGDLAIIRL